MDTADAIVGLSNLPSKHVMIRASIGPHHNYVSLKTCEPKLSSAFKLIETVESKI